MVSGSMIAHAVARLYLGTVGGFGEFLNSFGLQIGVAIAWGVTLFELLGGVFMLFNYATRWISMVWMVELVTGILLVHLNQGWFVVGAGTGGMEYSVILIVALLVIQAHSD